jgi:biopolymer transport protein ExbD
MASTPLFRALIAAVLAGALLLIAGCGAEEREPPPTIVLQVLEQPGTYLLQGRRLFTGELQVELQALADKYRRATTGTSRAIVQVYYPSTVRYKRVQDLLGWCGQVGLDKVTVHVRDASTPLPIPTAGPGPAK